MRISFIIAILLISTTFAAESESENKFANILSQIKEQPFGNAIGSLIQMHLKNDSTAPDGKLQAILKILEQLQKTIETAQANAETRYESKSAWCQDTIEQLQKEYDSAKSAAASSSSEYNSLDREKGEKKNDLNGATESKSDLREDLAKAQSDLQAEDTQFESRFADYTEAIAACQEAIRLLLQLGNRSPGAMFIQMNQSFGKVREQLEKHAKNTESAFIEPILDVLTQLSNGAQFDYSTITNIVDLVRSLLKNLQAAQQELESNHGKVEADLDQLIANLAGQLENV